MKITKFFPAAIIPRMSRPAFFDATIRLLGLLIVIFAVLLTSRWLTELTAPRLVAKLPSMPIAAPENSLKTVGKLFGTSKARSESLDGLYLAGLFSGSRGSGFATFRTRSGSISVFPGGEISPGVTLKQIEKDRVIVLSAGVQKELRLNEGGMQPASPSGQTAVIAPQPLPAANTQGVESGNPQPNARRAAGPQENEQ